MRDELDIYNLLQCHDIWTTDMSKMFDVNYFVRSASIILAGWPENK
jgi:hypothetical protein